MGLVKITARWEAEQVFSDINDAHSGGILGTFIVKRVRECHGTFQIEDERVWSHGFAKNGNVPLLHMEIKLETKLAAAERDHWKAAIVAADPSGLRPLSKEKLTECDSNFWLNAQAVYELEAFEKVLANWNYFL